jgi:hypothetical protein
MGGLMPDFGRPEAITSGDANGSINRERLGTRRLSETPKLVRNE